MPQRDDPRSDFRWPVAVAQPIATPDAPLKSVPTASDVFPDQEDFQHA